MNVHLLSKIENHWALKYSWGETIRTPPGSPSDAPAQVLGFVPWWPQTAARTKNVGWRRRTRAGTLCSGWERKTTGVQRRWWAREEAGSAGGPPLRHPSARVYPCPFPAGTCLYPGTCRQHSSPPGSWTSSTPCRPPSLSTPPPAAAAAPSISHCL